MDIYNLKNIKGTNEYGGTVKLAITKETPSNLMSGIFILKPGEKLIPDIHDSDEVFYVIRGTLTLKDDKGNEDHLVEEGNMVLIPKGQTHLSSNQGNEEVAIFFATLSG